MAAPSPPPSPADNWLAGQDGDVLLIDLLDGETNDPDALLAELLGEQHAWEARTQPPQQSSDEEILQINTRPSKRRALASADGVVTAKGADVRTRTVAVLREEVSQLTNELKRLRSEMTTAIEPSAITAKEAAIDARFKRRRVEDECRQLREAVYAQTQFLRGLRCLFAMPIPLSPMDLTHYLHNYTRLPRDRSTRWNEYAALAEDARFQAAMDMLCRETKKKTTAGDQTEIVPSLSSPYITTEVLRHADGFTIMSTNVYALATDDLSAALRGVCMAVDQITVRDPVYVCVSRKKQLVDPDASLPSATASSIAYRVTGVDHKIGQDQLAVESHNIVLYKQTQNYALLLEDFIDHDDLHPQDETTDITRQVVAAWMMRRELCSDGLEHTVFRSLRTRRYRFHEHTPPPVLQRFQQIFAEVMNANDMIMRQLILDSIAQEEQALRQAMARFTVPVSELHLVLDTHEPLDRDLKLSSVALQPSTIFDQTGNATWAMSAEYLLKMELLRRNREELTARRQEIERRIALREATAAEFSAVALQSSKQKWKSLRASAITAKKRNDEFVREIHETQRKVDDMYVRTKQKLWPSDNQLEIEKARYLRKVEELYPAWQEKQQAVRVQTLRELEEKKRAIEKRRYLAKKTFETEQTLDDLIRQTNHEIELAHNLEKNEAFEREVLRNQSAIQSQRVEESIREHATGARMYMTQQAVEQLTEAHQLQGDVQEKIFETFSPRGAVNAMRQANQSINFVESVDNNADDAHFRPRRGQSIAVPAPQYRDPATEGPRHSNQFDPYAHTQLMDEHDPATQARAWARSGFPTSQMVNSSQRAPAIAHPSSQRVQSTPPTLIPTHREYLSAAHQPTPVVRDERLVPATLPDQTAFATDNPVSTFPTYPTTSTSGSTSGFPARELPVDTKPELVVNNANAKETSERYPQSQLQHEYHEEKTSASPSQTQTSVGTTWKPNSMTIETKAASALVRDATPPKATPQREHGIHRNDESSPAAEASIHPVTSIISLKDEEPPTEPTEITVRNTYVQEMAADKSAPEIPVSHPREKTPPRQHEPREPSLPAYDTYKLVEITTQKESFSMAKIEETKEEDKEDGDITRSFDSLASANFSPAKSDAAYNPMMQSADLSLNLVNSYESNQSSLMDFSVGKLLQTPQKLDFASTAMTLKRETPPKNEVVESPERKTESVIFGGLSTSIDSYAAESPDRFDPVQHSTSARTSSFEKPSTASVTVSAEERTGSAKFKTTLDHARDAPAHKPQPLVFSSLDSMSEPGSPAIPRLDGQDTMIESVGDFGSPIVPSHSAPAKSFPPRDPSPPVSPTYEDDGDQAEPSLVASLSMPERLKALTSLIARVEEGTNDGEQISSSLETGSSHDTKRELLRMAVSGRKAQINFFGSDVCFELLVELAKELGPVLFPAKAFEGIMNDQKMKKVHQNAKEKEPEMWKAFASHIKQLHTAKAMPVGALADLFTNAFLSHDPSNQRSQRKLREFLLSLCGATDNTPSKQPMTPASPRQASQSSESSFQPRTVNSFERETNAAPQMPSLLQTAFLQASSPPKQAKTYGIASGAKKKSSSDDVLKSMAASPTKLSQKLLRGGKMGDYSEFEEEEEINLENLIGSKASSGSASSSSISKATASYRTGASSSSATSRLAAMREDKDDFDVDF